jgi:hypothetical protein
MDNEQVASHIVVRLDSAGDPSAFEGVVEALNSVLVGKRVVYTVLDTADPYPSQKSKFSSVQESISVFANEHGTYGRLGIDLHGHGMIIMRPQPIEHEGETHRARVEINRDHVSIDQPYLFGTRGVHWLHYAITVIPSTDIS